MDITGGELLLELFQVCGVECIFSSPGTELAPVWEGLLKRQARDESAPRDIHPPRTMPGSRSPSGRWERSWKTPPAPRPP
jgi:hypothetical protein